MILSSPAGAEIRVDGEAVGRAPVTRHLVPGDHLIEATWPGQPPISDIGKVVAGRSTVMQLRLPGAPAVAPPPPPPAAAPPPPVPPTPPPPGMPPPPPPPPGPLSEQTPDASGNAAEARTVGDVLNPLHPERRHTLRYAANLGFYCPMFTLSDSTKGSNYSGCAFYVQPAALQMYLGDFHTVLMAGGAFLVAGGFGFAVGSPYIQLGGGSGRWALAIRTNLEILGGQTSASLAFPGDTFVGLAITPHVNLSYAILHNLTLQAHLGIGIMPGGSVTNGRVGKDLIQFYFETHFEFWVGVRL